MKKRIAVIYCLGIVSIASVFAIDWAAAGGWHRYTDYNGYSGLAKSFYIGNTRQIDSSSFQSYLKNYIKDEGVYKIIGVHSKLSKIEKFCLLSELNSWDLENGDIYVVRIQTGPDVQVIIASVDRKGNVTNWYGYDCD